MFSEKNLVFICLEYNYVCMWNVICFCGMIFMQFGFIFLVFFNVVFFEIQDVYFSLLVGSVIGEYYEFLVFIFFYYYLNKWFWL